MVYYHDYGNIRSVRRKGDGAWYFGKDGVGIDVKLFGGTSSSSVLWDNSADAMVFDAADINLGDTDFIKFGDSSDITMNFDGTNFEIEGAAAATSFLIGAASKVLNVTLTGTLTVGVDDTGYDVKLFGATSGSFLLWDESANTLILNAADIQLTTGRAIKTSTTDDHYLDIQAYDVDGTAFTSVIRVQNANDVELGFFGATPVTQQTHIADAAGDTAANNKTTIDAILDVLEAFGLVATS